jgi:hypothetical protein
MRRNHFVEVVVDELQKAGIDYEIETSKHVKIKFELNGRALLYVVPASGSDRYGHKNARSGIRRIIRAAA